MQLGILIKDTKFPDIKRIRLRAARECDLSVCKSSPCDRMELPQDDNTVFDMFCRFVAK